VLVNERPQLDTPRTTYDPKYGSIRVVGTVTNDGGIFEAGQNDRTPGSSLTIAIDSDATLINKGFLESYAYNRLTIGGGPDSTLENDGSIIAFGGPITVSVHLTGVGETNIVGAGVGLSSSVEIDAAVEAGQTFHIGRGPLQLDQPLTFLGQVEINQQDLGGSVRLEALDAASWDIKDSLVEFFNASGDRIDTLQFTTPRDPATLAVYTTPDANYGQTVNVTNSRPFGVPSNGTVLPYSDMTA